MNIATAFAACSLEELRPALDGGTLTIYSVARPLSADLPVDRSSVLATFTFASTAFAAATEAGESPRFAANPVAATSVGTPGFARARTADGAVVADFSAGPGDREVKFSEVSCSAGAPVELRKFTFGGAGGWPEKPEFYQTRPRSGFPMPRSL